MRNVLFGGVFYVVVAVYLIYQNPKLFTSYGYTCSVKLDKFLQSEAQDGLSLEVNCINSADQPFSYLWPKQNFIVEDQHGPVVGVSPLTIGKHRFEVRLVQLKKYETFVFDIEITRNDEEISLSTSLSYKDTITKMNFDENNNQIIVCIGDSLSLNSNTKVIDTEENITAITNFIWDITRDDVPYQITPKKNVLTLPNLPSGIYDINLTGRTSFAKDSSSFTIYSSCCEDSASPQDFILETFTTNSNHQPTTSFSLYDDVMIYIHVKDLTKKKINLEISLIEGTPPPKVNFITKPNSRKKILKLTNRPCTKLSNSVCSTFVNLHNLYRGNYVFEVKVIQPEGCKSKINNIKFKVTPPTTFGIDFGNYKTCASVMIDNEIQQIPIFDNPNLSKGCILSVVSFDIENNAISQVYIGEAAALRKLSHSNSTFYNIKQLLGVPANQIDSFKHFPFKLKPSTHANVDGLSFILPLNNGEIEFLPEELAGLIIHKIKQETEQFLKSSLTAASISIPHSATLYTQQATKDASRLAGFQHGLELYSDIKSSVAVILHEQNIDATDKRIIFIDSKSDKIDAYSIFNGHINHICQGSKPIHSCAQIFIQCISTDFEQQKTHRQKYNYYLVPRTIMMNLNGLSQVLRGAIEIAYTSKQTSVADGVTYLAHKSDFVILPLSSEIPHSFGVKMVDGHIGVVIPSGVHYPVTRTKQFITSNNYQSSVTVDIYSGENLLVKDNTWIGRVFITDLPKRLKGQVTIDLIFDITDDGTLKVTAIETTSQTKHADVEFNVFANQGRLTIGQIDRYTEKLEKIYASSQLVSEYYDKNGIFDGIFV